MLYEKAVLDSFIFYALGSFGGVHDFENIPGGFTTVSSSVQ